MAKSTSGKTRKNGSTKAKRTGAFKLSAQPVVGASTEENVHKYEATREPAPTPAFENLGELPQSYGTTLFLTARDPHWLFSYWDFDPKSSPGSQFFLKIFTSDGNEESQIEINPEAKTWYVPVSKPGTTYYAELGYFDKGTWTTIAKSETATAPIDTLADEAQATFATVPFHLTFQRLIEMVRSSMQKGETLVQALARLQGEGRRAAFGGSVTGWTDEQRQLLAALFGRGLVSKAQLAELAAPGASSLFSGIISQLAQAAWGSEVTSWFSAIGASWSAQPFSQEKPREFFMHVNAEVIFYGGTHPDAKVWIDGKEIRLNPDGTFRYHFKFPDGNYEIPIVAQSPDKVEER